MNVLILGASCKVGLALTRLALIEGFEVSAFVRSPKRFPISHDSLTLLKGDILNYEEVYEATVAQDIIFSVLGTNSKKPNTILADDGKYRKSHAC